MNASEKLNQYINSFAERWRQCLLGRGLLIVLATFTVVSLIAAYFSLESGFDNNYFWLGRLVLVVATIVAFYFAISRPLADVNKTALAELEQRQSDFSGRINTFRDMAAGDDNKQEANGMRELLAADALTISKQSPSSNLLGNRELRLPYFVAACVAIVLLLMIAIGPNMMNHSLRYLYAGWAFKELLPPQTIQVSPGDVIVKRGGNIKLTASAEGFKADELVLHVKTGDTEWQQINMSRTPTGEDDFDFSLFSIRESMQYYITSAAIRTPSYTIDVIDLPGISSVTMTYRFPDWTQLDDEVHERLGDIAVLPGTEIDIEVFTDAPLPAGELVVNGESVALEIDSVSEQARSSTKFTVDAQGDYYIAALIGGEQVRLSDDYFISLLEDQKPEIKFAFPGRDWNASNIEEVLAEVSVKDDFGIEKVELSYAVNGGEWQTVDLTSEEFVFEKDADQTLDHLFFLEEFTVEENIYAEPEPIDQFEVLEEDPFAELGISTPYLDGQLLDGAVPEVDEVPLEVIGTETVPLQPGDLISYYARVSDRESTEQTDIFFIEVQPFDRRFSQAEQGGGGLAGGQGERELEISQRQREIIVSTWNLIREQNEGATKGAADKEELAARLDDSTKLLAQLQRSLAEQAQSLIETARSRQLTTDQRIETYTKHIENAIKAMQPASEELLNLNLTEAIGPEQTALQHLLRADAVFNEVEVSLNNQGQGGQGGGGGARDELAEMFELEIDMERNQYETGSRATLNEEEEQVDETLNELEDLARRQQQLANNIRNNPQITEAEQYQQELLRREAEQLQERIDRIEEQQQANAGAQGQAAGQADNADGQPQNGEGESSQGSQQELAQTSTSELNRRLQSAMDAMDRAAEAMRNGDAEQLQRDAGEAQRQLEGAGDQLTENQILARRQAFEEMAETAKTLYDQQAQMEEKLLDGVEQAIATADPITDTVTSPFSYTEEVEMAEQKVEMLDDLQRLKSDMITNAAKIKSELPRIARTLESADAKLKESEVSIRMNLAADYMRRGESLYIANSEGLTTSALRSLRDSTEQALRALSSDEVAEQSELDRIMEDIRAGRSELQEIAEQAQDGQGNTENRQQERSQDGSQSEGQESGQQGNPGEGELAQGEAQDNQSQAGEGQGPAANGEGSGQLAGNGTEGQQPGEQGEAGQQGSQAGGGNAGGRWGDWTGTRGFNPELTHELNRELTQTLNDTTNLTAELRDRGVAEDQLDGIREVIQELQNRAFSNNLRDPSLIELNDTLALLEELEARVEQGLQGDDNKVRTESPQVIPSQYKEAVADYYRRLSDDTAQQQQ